MKIIIYLFIFVLLFTACDQSRGSYPAQVMCGDVIYSESLETVPFKDIGEQIGEIKKRVRPLPKNNGEANSAEVGSKLFKIVGEDQKKAIAIKKDDVYFKATH
ncbi:hypothetical protein LOZ80_12250 [Paenibacillus sp. HWE-109]|uniref:hypothetical protein n=1 Tax=Paenibacillus sp. HWE-109 TaxID=1306526 RepID=UPI001EDE2153|nr:hypothetical protein [Paenibacillus sp. HWE-109]UKS29652.1 hypothetical protein LOZ80_12250 [Paenibacillus sp. HWE-109]